MKLDEIKYWIEDNKRKAITIVVLILAILGGLGYWIFSPGQRAIRAEKNQVGLVKKMTPNDKTPSGKFTYDKSTRVPDFDKLMFDRQDGKGLVLRSEVSIPSKNIDVPVFEGVSPYTLSWGAGTAKYGEQLGKRNYAIEAHNYMKLGYADNWFFSNSCSQY